MPILSFLNDKLFGHPCDKMDFCSNMNRQMLLAYIKPLLPVDKTIQAT